MKYETILFDLDGTILDTNELILVSFMYTLEREYPGKFTREHVIPYMGEPLPEQMARFDATRIEELVRIYREHNVRVHDELVTAFPHVVEVIAKLHELGVKMGIVTSKQRRTVDMGLRLFDLEKYMDVVITHGDTEKSKPAPDPILKAMELMNANPASTLMIGDSEYDLQSAKAAGVDSVGVAWSLRGVEYVSQFDPTYIIHDIRDLLTIQGSLVQEER
ncbi:MAG: pyrophosphatase PpaX [Bacilli bacterium]